MVEVCRRLWWCPKLFQIGWIQFGFGSLWSDPDFLHVKTVVSAISLSPTSVFEYPLAGLVYQKLLLSRWCGDFFAWLLLSVFGNRFSRLERVIYLFYGCELWVWEIVTVLAVNFKYHSSKRWVQTCLSVIFKMFGDVYVSISFEFGFVPCVGFAGQLDVYPSLGIWFL
jgi:hypothetical protein